MLKGKLSGDKGRKVSLLIAGLLLFCVSLFFNAKYFHFPKILVSDELANYVVQGNPSIPLGERIFTRSYLRPIPHAIYALMFKLSGSNFDALSVGLFAINYLLSLLVFAITYKLYNPEAKERQIQRLLFAFAAGTLNIATRFMQSHIFTLTSGIMEIIAHASTLLIFYFLIHYVSKDDKKRYYLSCILFVAAVYSHERYMSLIIPLMMAPVLKHVVLEKPSRITKALKELAVPTGIFIVYIINRMLAIDDFLRGTNDNTSIMETFNIATFIKYVFAQIAYIFGINAGPLGRNGIPYDQVPGTVYFFIVISIICVLFVAALTAWNFFRAGREQRRNIGVILAIGFTIIAGCIVFSSVTIGVLLRFVYVSYSIFLILLFTMLSYISFHKKKGGRFPKTVSSLIALSAALYFICAVTYESYYRIWLVRAPNIPDIPLAESLYDITLGAYPDDFQNKTVVVINDFRYSTPKKWREFFSPYMNSSGLDPIFAKSLRDLGPETLAGKDILVIYADRKNSQCYDITSHFLRLTEDGTIPYPFEHNGFASLSGAGTKDSPYHIERKSHLIVLRDLVNSGESFEGLYFRQTADIDVRSWIPIGVFNPDMPDSGCYFAGTYDGNGYKIQKLDCKSDGYQNHNGLFGLLDGTVMNLGIESGKITGTYAGSFASKGTERALIYNCYNKASVVGKGEGSRAGGIADDFAGRIAACVNMGKLEAEVVAGIVSYSAGRIEDCYATTSLTNTEIYMGTMKDSSQFDEKEAESVVANLNYRLAVNEISPYRYLTNFWVADNNSVFFSPDKVKFLDYLFYTLKNKPVMIESEIPAVRFSGEGLRSLPYLIQTPGDLAVLRDLVNEGESFEGIYFRQIADIDLGIYDNWIPIGVVAMEDMSQERKSNFFFRGDYNGDGYAIYNLNCHSDGYLNHNGLFGMLDGTVMNLGIESGSVSGLAAGSIASQGTHRAVIFNCYNKAAVSGNYRAGGIADLLSGGTVISCVNIGEVSGYHTAGIVSGTAAVVENCYATTPSVNDEFYEGTIVGGGQFAESEMTDVAAKLNQALRYRQGNYWIEDGEIALTNQPYSIINHYDTFFAAYKWVLFAVLFAVLFISVLTAIMMQSALIRRFRFLNGQKVFSVILLSALVLYWIVFLITRGEIAANYFLRDTRDSFMDFFNPMRKSLVNTYSDPYYSNYPPLANIIFFIFQNFIPEREIAESFLLDKGLANMMSANMAFMFYAMPTILLLLKWLKKYTVLEDHAAPNLALVAAMFCSGPFMFAYERGNNVLWVVMLVGIFVMYYEHENKGYRELALAALAVAVGLKIFPAIFAVMLLPKRRIKDFFKAALYSFVAMFLPFIFYPPRSVQNFILNLLGRNGQINPNYEYSYGFSEAARIATKLIFREDLLSVSVLWYLLPIVLCAVGFLLADKDWKRAMYACLLLLWIPNNSFPYNFCFFAIPLLIFLREKLASAYDWLYLGNFLFLFLLYPFPIIGWTSVSERGGVTAGIIITHLAMWALCIIPIVQALCGRTETKLERKGGRSD